MHLRHSPLERAALQPGIPTEPPPASIVSGMISNAQRTHLHLPTDIPLEDWKSLGEQIFVIWDSSGWWLGDWLVYGQDHFPSRYRIAINETSLSYQTLRNYSWIARKFPVERRRKELSFQHHSEVASLTEEMQEKWLDRCQKFNWSRNELRRRIKAALAAGGPQADNVRVDHKIDLRVEAQRKARWAKAAEFAEKDLDSWIVSVLDEVAESVMSGNSGTFDIGTPGNTAVIDANQN